MYDKLIKLNFEEAKKNFASFRDVNSARKTLVFKNSDDIESYSNQSDVIASYDLLGKQELLLLAERFNVSKFTLRDSRALSKIIKEQNKKYEDYICSFTYQKKNKIVDITLMKRNVYESLKEN